MKTHAHRSWPLRRPGQLTPYWLTSLCVALLLTLPARGQNPPVIVEEPEDTVISLGGDASLKVRATATAPAWVEWYRADGDSNTLLLGTNNNARSGVTLTIARVQAADARGYFAVITNDWGTATSRVARVEIKVPQFVEVTDPGWTNVSAYSWAGAWGDYDGDGYIDLFVANTSTWSDRGTPFLYRNNGDGTFTEKYVSEVGPLLAGGNAAVGGYWGDLNNDGHLDLFMPNCGSNNCFVNLGDGTFAAAKAGDLTKPSNPWGWGNLVDYDQDGWLDAFSCTAGGPTGTKTNLLYHALGDLRFEWVTQGPVVSDQVGVGQWSNAAVWSDFDNDGDPDLLVANWQGVGAFFYRNDGRGQFTRLTTSILEQRQYAAGHHAWGDYDNDGDLDVVAAGGPVRLFQNNTPADFTLVTNWNVNASVPSWVDYDNDGYLDLALAQGQGSPQKLWLLRNKGDGTFERVEDAFTRTAGNWLSIAWGDYDNDGFPDLFVAHESGQNRLFRNLGNANHWIKFQLEGTVANRSAIGAKVRVQAIIGGKSVWQMREISGGNTACHDLRPNFGLGDATTVERVIIEWPSGIVQELTNQPANQFLTVTEPPRLRPLASNGFQIQCWINQSFDVETSTDLTAWAHVTTLTNSTGTLEFHDEVNNDDDCRYYRVRAR